MEKSSPDSSAKENVGRLCDGAVLLARDALSDPNFSATVVLMCIYAKDGGAYGLVLNRPSHMPLSEVFDGFSELTGDSREVCIGGPVQQEELQIIEITDTGREQSHEVAPRVFLGGKWESVEEMLMVDPDSTRLFLGYSGWAPGQLENEIAAGAWDVFRVDVEKLLANPAKMLTADVRSIGEYLESIRIPI
jgi:putative transcriptional regulator